MTTPAELADRLLDLAVTVLEDLEATHAPGLELPRVFGGYGVGPDARADLAFTLGLLHGEGRAEVAGRDGAEVALEIVRRLDGAATHTFYSYRAAETVLRLGGLDGNPRLAAWSEADLANVEAAIDSTSFLPLLDEGKLPGNYMVVLARCEHARARLGRLPADHRLDELVEGIRERFAALPTGWWDDFGGANFDMYTPDVYLFAEPFADRLGEAWRSGLTRVLADLADVATPGGAVSWGRSTGGLGIVMNVELGAVAVGRELTDEPAGWLARAEMATVALQRWFDRGVVTAHQHRMTMGYRGPERRLQMTLDLLGKLVQAAHELRRVDSAPGSAVTAATPAEAFAPVDRLVVFDSARNAGVWTRRGGGLDLVLPLVGGMWVDYLPTPRWPGTFEVPVDSMTLISWLPAIHADGSARTVQGPPAEVTHRPGELAVRHDTFRTPDLGASDDAARPIDGSRTARYRIEGRTLVVDETLVIDRDPATVEAVAVEIPEVRGRPLTVEFATDGAHTTTVVDTAGMQLHRSFWNEHVRVHELVMEPARRLSYAWRVTPALRVASSAFGHGYDEHLYRPMGDRVVRRSALDILDDPIALSEVDVFHLHWPEWCAGTDPDRSRAIIANLRAAGTTIFWTQHNRKPHYFPDATEVYDIWAEAADVVVHHSEYGRRVMQAQYRYGEHTRHAVIPHGHWGERHAPHRPAGGRSEAEQRVGLEPVGIRLGIVGAPRDEKDVQLVIDAVHASDRDDLELCVWSLADETVPDDPRIRAWPYRLVDEADYTLRLHTLDALVMPFADGMLTTGTMGDALGAGVPVIASSWGYLRETLGDAALYYDDTGDRDATREGLTRLVDGLTAEDLARARAAVPERREATDWTLIAEATLALLDEVVASR